ncbi:hypothetical protein [Allorhizocola rhizosphaerae]|uniref:hypothetical protein n=1 Tax=Allorhizocola rhizosphaerae TaxID=1872709 RepID=UPI000E3C4F4F|nr:hypothetical protein [Allorhizocola rhizosphaerae]
MKYHRDERAAKRGPVLVPVVSQAVDEGYRLVGPEGALTATVEHVHRDDNHPAGPDTHVVISFADGTQLEFPFGVPLTAVWHAEQRPFSDAELRAATPNRWGAAVA